MNKQEAEQFRRAQQQLKEQSSVVQRALEDREFYGNGTRWQNVFGTRAVWWQFSFDTSRASGRALQALWRVLFLAGAIWFVVLVAAHT